MRVILVTMPWQVITMPSLPLGILHAILEREGRHEVQERYANIDWVDFMARHGEGRPGRNAYIAIENSYLHAVGDWIFSAALNGTDEKRDRQFVRYLRAQGQDSAVDLALALRPLAVPFIEELAASLAAAKPDVVGFTSTFQQNVASLAAAKALRARLPGVKLILGGSNCDGPQGPALQRAYPFLDFVVTGEGEVALPRLLAALETGGSGAGIPGVAWWDDGLQVIEAESAELVDMTTAPIPDFDAYFARAARSTVVSSMELELSIEGSRGCWWGQRHHCTFCGLTGGALTFRSKDAGQLTAEIDTLVRRHQILDIVTVDKILDLSYFETMLPALRDLGWGLRTHYEVKANLSRAQVQKLHDAKISHIEPGIESLSSGVLRLMNKGVSGPRNVRMLRDCGEINITVGWNFLYGFPGEEETSYRAVIEQLPALVHLQPPGGVGRIMLHRFSENFQAAASLFAWHRPAECYRYVYDLPEQALEDIVYRFDYAPAGLGGPVEALLQQRCADWRASYASSSLTAQLSDGRLILDDQRAGWPARRIVLEDPCALAAYLALADDLTSMGVQRVLREQGLESAEAEVAGWLQAWKQEGLVFEDEGRYVALATTAGRSAVALR